MAAFKIGDKVFFRKSDMHNDDGTWKNGTVTKVYVSGDTVGVEYSYDGSEHHVSGQDAKAMGFEVGDVLLTASHSGEMGWVVANGNTASGKRAFSVRFESDQTTEWFTEDQVFIERTQRVIVPDL